jgi:hypothetical protein
MLDGALRVERAVRDVSGVRPAVDPSKGEVCPRCRSGYINTVGRRGTEITVRCHNCGYTFTRFSIATLIAYLFIIGFIIWLCAGGLGRL